MQTGVFDEVEDVYNSGTGANLSMPPWGHLSFTLDFVATMAPSENSVPSEEKQDYWLNN